MVYSREESFVATRKRHPFTIHYTTGANREGQIVAAKVEILADAGAYCASSPVVIMKSLVHAAGPYEIPNISIKISFVYTNNPVGGSMRGLGVPQTAFAHESQMDILAKTLHLDPFSVRLRNGFKPGSITATGQQLGDSVSLGETLLRVRDEIERIGTPPSSIHKRYGWGIASMFYGIGSPGRSNPGRARVEINDAGKFTLYVGMGDLGQGSSTALLQIAAEVLKCQPHEIRLIAGDTDCCPDSGITAASRVTYIVGKAVQIAAGKLRQLLQEAAAAVIETSPERLQLGGGIFYAEEEPVRRVAVPHVVKILKQNGVVPVGEGNYDPDFKPLDPKTGQGRPMATYAFATQGALIGVDINSGEVEVLSIVACHDVGKAVNPAGVTGQIEGAVSMGLGFSLMEEVVLQEGRIRNPYFSGYFLPTVLDVPETVSLIVETPEATGPFGAKGVAEPALIPTAPAIINAIHSATGIRVNELPVTPERLWRLLCVQFDRKST